MMRLLRTVLREIFGLFVDDSLFAMAIVGWIALLWFLLPPGARDDGWGGVALFAGLAIILAASAVRRAFVSRAGRIPAGR